MTSYSRHPTRGVPYDINFINGCKIRGMASAVRMWNWLISKIVHFQWYQLLSNTSSFFSEKCIIVILSHTPYPQCHAFMYHYATGIMLNYTIDYWSHGRKFVSFVPCHKCHEIIPYTGLQVGFSKNILEVPIRKYRANETKILSNLWKF